MLCSNNSVMDTIIICLEAVMCKMMEIHTYLKNYKCKHL